MIARMASQFASGAMLPSAAARASSTAQSRAMSLAQQAGGATPTVLMASGRGGSGSTMLSALLAMAAAGEGHRVLLIDADDLVGPLSFLLGVTPSAGWADLRGGRVAPQDVTTPISTTLTLVAGGDVRVGAAHVTPAGSADRKACMRRLSVLTERADLVVIDCGARIDTLLSAITPHAGERVMVVTSGSDPVALAASFAVCKAVHARHGALGIDVLVNRHETKDAKHCFDTIDSGVQQFLGIAVHYAGAVPSDPTLDAALRAGMSFPDAATGSPAATAAHDAVMRVMSGSPTSRSGL